MSDNLQERGPADRSRINLNERWEVDYWSKTLGCTPDQLREAVAKAGSSVDKVREQLGKGRQAT
ncbi:DUF3606 domain-containing protein [Bordetella genomosp. 11]|uniref:DUF3606 domain-containing protein n=1 Tax=Bordetella genomosp. 11 TaxID=1416808 RepID=A0A261UHB3_9BORD|nr:DUF3606 domain-containing protein [Bordetella genomosp. 11]OZI61304.1 DUF3606 domain-containing protein [Bordetella genomosp. 11]